jgi:hypothetical protein
MANQTKNAIKKAHLGVDRMSRLEIASFHKAKFQKDVIG